MAALQSPKLSVGVRVPGGTPVNCPGGEMVYTGDLKSPVERHAGSSPAPGTK